MTAAVEAIVAFQPILQIAARKSCKVRVQSFDYGFQVGVGMMLKTGRTAIRLGDRVHVPRTTFPGALLEQAGLLPKRYRDKTETEMKLEALRWVKAMTPAWSDVSDAEWDKGSDLR